MSDFLDFREMITPRIIQGAFVVLSAGCILLGLIVIFQGGENSLTRGLGIGVLGPLIIRIYCEILIVVFRIHETLNEVSNQLDDLLDAVEGDEAGLAK